MRRILSVCLLCVSVSGEDFLRSGASARSIGSGGGYFSGTQSALDAMAVNPAGLAQLGSRSIEVSMLGVVANGTFVNSANPAGRLAVSGMVPYGAFGTPLGGSRFKLGAAVIPEIASAARWNYVDTPGGTGGVSYGSMQHRSEIVALRTAIGVGFHAGSRWQFGATVGAVHNRNKLQTAYGFQTHPALAGMKTRLDLETDGIGWNGTAGFVLRALKRVHLGAAYKSSTTIVSRGVASGNADVQFAAIGLGAARPDFRYDARVDNVLPQAVTVHGDWQLPQRVRLVGQTEWINWQRAFQHLPVTLTRGNNADINGLLSTDVIRDIVPVLWRDQLVGRLGLEKSWRETFVLRAGYAHSTNPVPAATLSPLTAAIARHSLSTGIGHSLGRLSIDLAYRFAPTANESVGQSLLKSAEYSGSRVAVGSHAVVVTTAIRF